MLLLLLLLQFLLVLQQLLLVLGRAGSVDCGGAAAGEFEETQGGDDSLLVTSELDRHLTVSVDLLYGGIVILAVSWNSLSLEVRILQSSSSDLTWVDGLTTLPNLPGFDGKDRGGLCPAALFLGFVEGALQVVISSTGTWPLFLTLTATTTNTTATAAAFTQVVVDQVKCQVDNLLQISFQS